MTLGKSLSMLFLSLCLIQTGKSATLSLIMGEEASTASGYENEQTPRSRWTVEKAKAWGEANPWFCGINYVPSNAMNDVEIWDKRTFSPKVIQREFALAKELGFNCVRIFLQYKVYEDNPKWFRKAFEKFLRLADEANMKVMPTLFDDCAFGPTKDPQLGKQSEPYPGWNMWGWVPSPGRTMVVDDRTHGLLEKYVKDLIGRYRDDDRIFAWDLYNEPANDTREFSEHSYRLVRKCFTWAREVNPTQPLTVGRWNNDETLNKIVTEESDIITYHCYGPAQPTRDMINELSKLGRPLICTEWMLRYSGCTIENCLGIYKETGVGCIMWGFVNGKSQVHLPFGYMGDKPPYDGPWKHDIYHNDLTPYDVHELELIKQATGVGGKQ